MGLDFCAARISPFRIHSLSQAQKLPVVYWSKLWSPLFKISRVYSQHWKPVLPVSVKTLQTLQLVGTWNHELHLSCLCKWHLVLVVISGRLKEVYKDRRHVGTSQIGGTAKQTGLYGKCCYRCKCGWLEVAWNLALLVLQEFGGGCWCTSLALLQTKKSATCKSRFTRLAQICTQQCKLCSRTLKMLIGPFSWSLWWQKQLNALQQWSFM